MTVVMVSSTCRAGRPGSAWRGPKSAPIEFASGVPSLDAIMGQAPAPTITAQRKAEGTTALPQPGAAAPPAFVSPTARVAIVTTLRDIPATMLASFVGWHLKIGFVRLYLYFDDPDDAGIAAARRLRREVAKRGYGDDAVRVVVCDAALRSAWSALQTAMKWHLSKVLHHVEVRQQLNAEHALRSALADADIEWLLHIDSDEMFHIDDLDAAAHFGRLSAHGCVNFRYPIHEACPEAVHAATDVFRDVTLFRRHPETVEAAVRAKMEAAAAEMAGAAGAEAASAVQGRAAAAWAFWQQPGRHHFLGSTQGKSATRVLPGVWPISVHTWYPPTADQLPMCWAGFRDTQDALGASLRVVSPMGSPCILHYISCDFDFWQHKYRLLGRFGDKPGGEAAGGVLPEGCFHTRSRDFVASATDEEAKAHYRATVCLESSEEARRQVEAGVCFRADTVRTELHVWHTGGSPMARVCS